MKKRLTAIILCLIIAISGVVTLSACKPKTFTVTFEHGGTEEMQITVMPGYEDVPEIQTVSHWTELVFPVYICEKYTLSGWSEVISRIAKDTVITAMWTQNPFIVKFDPGNPEAIYVSGDKEQTVHNWTEIKPPIFTLPGYHVDWEGQYDVRKTDDTIVQAKWIPDEYKLNFIDEDGSAFDFEQVTVSYEQPIVGLPNPERENKRFGGWHLQEDVSNYVHEGDVWKKEGDATLVARWLEQDQYKITYINAYDIKGEPAYRATDADFVINTPSRYGYKFKGWTGTGIGDEPIAKVKIETGTSIDLEFTAHWEPKQRTLSLDSDGGRISQAGHTVTFGQVIGKLPMDVSKDGYDFIGWETVNGTRINGDTVWSWDPDKVSSLKAVYLRIYTIKLILKASNANVVATLIGGAESKYNLIQSETEEDVWIFTKTFREGDRLGELPTKEYIKIPDKHDEGYKFSCWAINKTGVKVNPSDILNETKFPGTRESGIIELSIKLSSSWTPFY